MKKKILSLALALVMAIGLAAPASAATIMKQVKAMDMTYTSIGEVSEGVLMVRRDSKVGFIDLDLKEVVPCQYGDARGFSEGLAAVASPSRWGYYEVNGRQVHGKIPSKWGFVDKTGKEVVPCQYEAVGDFSGGFAWVKKDRLYGFVDKTGKEVVPCQYQEVYAFSDGLARVRKDGLLGFVDTTGREVAPCMYHDAGDFSEGLAWVKKGFYYGFLDTTGAEAIPLQYKGAGDFSEGVAAVEDDASLSWGTIDKTGRVVIPFRFSSIATFSDGFAVVIAEKTGLQGMIDKTGREVIPCQYQEVSPFSDGLAKVRSYENGVGSPSLTGYFDTSGKQVIPFRYSFTSRDFHDGAAAVSLGGAYWGFIDRTGKEIVPLKYDHIESFSDGIGIVGNDIWEGKTVHNSFVDRTGKALNSLQYRTVEPFSNGFAKVCFEEMQNGVFAARWGVIDKKGRAVIPTNYKTLAFDAQSGIAFAVQEIKEYDAAAKMYFKTGEKLHVYKAVEGGTAYASTQNVLVDGKSVEFQCYALKDEKGNATNYIKLRDIAAILNGSAVQFNVGWNGAVNIETGAAYQPTGGEMKTPYSGNRIYEKATAVTNVNGVAADLSAILLKDNAGNGYTYYKLRDLGTALGFKVDWSSEKGIFIETE